MRGNGRIVKLCHRVGTDNEIAVRSLEYDGFADRVFFPSRTLTTIRLVTEKRSHGGSLEDVLTGQYLLSKSMERVLQDEKAYVYAAQLEATWR